MVGGVPVTDEEGEIAGGVREGDRNEGAAKDSDASETAGGLVEGKRGEIEETSDLILHLNSVCEILPRRNWARRSVHSILVRILPLLNSTPTFNFLKRKKNRVINYLMGQISGLEIKFGPKPNCLFESFFFFSPPYSSWQLDDRKRHSPRFRFPEAKKLIKVLKRL